MRIEVNLDTELLAKLQSQLDFFAGRNGKQILPATKYAFDTCADLIKQAWQNWALGGSIQGAADIKKPSAVLASSIRIEYNSDFNATIGTDNSQMQKIEEGQAGYTINMKSPSSAWLTSSKTRKFKSGKYKGLPYLIIPFRWGTPNKKGEARAHFGNVIDLKSYAIIKKKKQSIRLDSTHTEQNRYNENVLRSNYEWGGRLSEKETTDKNAVGMVRMKSNGGKNGSSTYFTFRTLSAHSLAEWKIKKQATPPNKVRQALSNALRDKINDIINDGFKTDLDL